MNAMYTSATLFEALAEVDAKFGKVADKEYDSVSTEVKKWFKRLAVSDYISYARIILTVVLRFRKRNEITTRRWPLQMLRSNKQVSRYISRALPLS